MSQKDLPDVRLELLTAGSKPRPLEKRGLREGSAAFLVDTTIGY